MPGFDMAPLVTACLRQVFLFFGALLSLLFLVLVVQWREVLLARLSRGSRQVSHADRGSVEMTLLVVFVVLAVGFVVVSLVLA